MPYSTWKIQGINRGQQVLQQICPVPLCKLTDSSSLVAVLWLYQEKNDLLCWKTPCLHSCLPFTIFRSQDKNNQWANSVKCALVKGEACMPETSLPWEFHCQEFGNEPQGPQSSPLAWERRHVSLNTTTCSARLFRIELCHTYSWLGSWGRKNGISGISTRQDHTT